MVEQVDVLVVGAGHNGLTAAALLAREGLDVLVLERRDTPGGAVAGEELVPGFRFSTCAYALHLLHEQVAEAIGLELDLRPSPQAIAVLPDGTVAHPDEEGARAVGALAGYRDWDRLWDEAARLLDPYLLGTPPAWEELAATPLGSATMDGLLREHFDDDRARLLFARPYFDGDPHEPGAPLAYAYVETSRCRDAAWQGVPRGGMGSVAAAFAAAAEKAGARIETGVEATRIAPPRVEVADGRTIRARAVVSNADPRRTRRLASLPPDGRPARGPAAKVHFALRGEPDLSTLGVAPEDLGVVHVLRGDGSFVELQLPSVADPSLAPPGCHTLSVYSPRGDTDALDDAARAFPNVRELVAETVARDAAGLERVVGLTGGDIHHLPHVPAAMFDRRGGARTEVDGLFVCGAGAHPGGEVSGAPGWNAAQAVLEELQ